jgi:ATP-dependent Clp protease ATP-binding subunit ClpC
LFDDANSDRLKIINMAEMTEKHYITRFVGSPPSYVGFNEKPLIPHDWLHKGRSILVLDEFEKAHPEIRQLFLGVLDKRYMDARKGSEGIVKLDFGMCLIIFTANIAGSEISRITNDEGRIGFGNQQKSEQEKDKLISGAAEKGLKEVLSPEFINRVDDIIVFKEIKDRSIHDKIVTKFIDEKNASLEEMLGEEAPYFAVTREFRDYLLDTVGNKGGRALKRQLEKEFFSKAASVFMGVDILGKPLVAHYDEEAGVEFYTDDSPPVIEVVEEVPEKKEKLAKDGDIYKPPSTDLVPLNT